MVAAEDPVISNAGTGPADRETTLGHQRRRDQSQDSQPNRIRGIHDFTPEEEKLSTAPPSIDTQTDDRERTQNECGRLRNNRADEKIGTKVAGRIATGAGPINREGGIVPIDYEIEPAEGCITARVRDKIEMPAASSLSNW